VIQQQSALAPAGPLASRTADLWWFAFWIAAVVYLITIAFLFWSLARARARDAVIESGSPAERGMTRTVGIGVAVTVAILLVFLGYDLSVGRTLSPRPRKPALTIDVTGHQWWWEATYSDTSAHETFTTANELHVPVGEPVLFVLTSQDVIHSWWVPNLAGKKDLIPGHPQTFWFIADTAGTYRGQCAEFCGMQHAKMAMYIVAESRDRYAEWVSQQQQPAESPSDSAQQRGHDLFVTRSCAMCHAIDGTEAGSHVGPDLTHIASRRTLAAGTLPNNRGAMAGWILDPQAAKPGARMPPNAMSGADLNALITYLESLK